MIHLRLIRKLARLAVVDMDWGHIKMDDALTTGNVRTTDGQEKIFSQSLSLAYNCENFSAYTHTRLRSAESQTQTEAVTGQGQRGFCVLFLTYSAYISRK